MRTPCLSVFCLCWLCLVSVPVRAELLQEFARSAATVRALSCTFAQDRQLAFLPQPLHSRGHFAFARDHGGAPALLWEYTAPSPSGLWHARGQSWLWAGDRSNLRRADSRESRVLLAVLRHVLQWFTVQPDTLREQYSITEDTETACLTLIPRRESLFTRLYACLREDRRSLRSLNFTERNGDSTTLTFAAPRINDGPLTTFPDGTPLP